MPTPYANAHANAYASAYAHAYAYAYPFPYPLPLSRHVSMLLRLLPVDSKQMPDGVDGFVPDEAVHEYSRHVLAHTIQSPVVCL